MQVNTLYNINLLILLFYKYNIKLKKEEKTGIKNFKN